MVSHQLPPVMASTTVIIVDDYESMRDFVRGLLQELDIKVVAEAADGDVACQQIINLNPHLVILDLGLPSMNGFQVVSLTRAQGFSGAFLILTGDPRPYVIQRIYELKVAGAISKLHGITTLKEGIKELLNGRTYYCPSIRQFRTQQVSNPMCPAKLLTNRETQILKLIGLAKTNEEIGDHLRISAFTVKGVRQSLIQKLGLHDTPGLVRFAQENGYVTFANTQ